MDLKEARKRIEEKRIEIRETSEAFAQKEDRLKDELREAERDYDLLMNCVDLDRLKLAESVIQVVGLKEYGSGDDDSVINDFLFWLATDKKPTTCYRSPIEVYYGTKNYDRWTHQRCDCSYGCGPRHGVIMFSVGLRDRGDKELSFVERDAAIYYLELIKRRKL